MYLLCDSLSHCHTTAPNFVDPDDSRTPNCDLDNPALYLQLEFFTALHLSQLLKQSRIERDFESHAILGPGQ